MAFCDEYSQLDLVMHDGRRIYYKGIGFDGSPRQVFWAGYIDPFLKDAIIQVLDSTLCRCKDAGIYAAPCLREAAAQLLRLVESTYSLMAETDYVLLTRNHQLMANPPKVPRRDVSSYVKRMSTFIEGQTRAAIAQTGSVGVRLRVWVSNHWILGLVVPIGGVLIAGTAFILDRLELLRTIAEWWSK